MLGDMNWENALSRAALAGRRSAQRGGRFSQRSRLIPFVSGVRNIATIAAIA
jgi:hypothetical protein